MTTFQLDDSFVNQLDEEGHIIIPKSMQKVLGQIDDQGIRSYTQKGEYVDYRLWAEAIFALTRGGVVSPGGAAALLKVSRASVYNNVKSGRLTMWTFIITKPCKREGRLYNEGYFNIWLPCCELDAWNSTIKWGRVNNLTK